MTWRRMEIMCSVCRYLRANVFVFRTALLVTCVVTVTAVTTTSATTSTTTAVAPTIGATSDASAAAEIKCSHVDELYYTSPASNCRSFYRCTHRGVREVKVCGGGVAVFDFRKQSCTTRVAATLASATCHDLNCVDRHDGVHQDIAHGCRRSFTCHAQQLASIDNCPPKKLHNGTACVRQELVQCPTSTSVAIPPPAAAKDAAGHTLCEDKKDGDHVDATSGDCTTYITCKNGRYVGRQRCNRQAVFDGASCVPSILHRCSTPTATTSTTTTTTTHLAEYMNDCQGRADGVYGSPSHGCATYMRCSSGRPVEINECRPGQYFSVETRECLAEDVERRAMERECFDMGLTLDCDAKPNGLYTENNCESYYYCFRGYKTLYRCSPGKLYNGSSCVPRSEHSCRPRNGDGDAFCSERPDGYYQDAKDGCRAYHFCSNGYKITYLCEMGLVYDSLLKKCVQPGAVSGPENGRECSSFHCYGKSDGYHADLRSNCRDYMFCRNSEKISHFTCRNGNVFNGQKCVPPDVWACPSLFNYRQINCMPRHCGHQCQQDGFYSDIKSECRDYFSCIGGTMSRLSCPGGMRFNGELCVAEDKVLCPVFCESGTASASYSHASCPLGGYVNV